MEKGEEETAFTQVIITALNEEKGIGLTIRELKEQLGFENILVVDGNSIDRTVEVARNLGAEVVYQDGRGKGDALAKGIESIRSEINYVVTTDADFTYPAQHIPRMIGILDKNPSIGMVSGNRFTKDLDSRSLRDVFYFGNRFLALTHNLLNGVILTDPLTGLRVVRAEILRNWKVRSKGFDVEVELNHQVERRGFGIVEVPIRYRERVGEKKLRVRHGAEIMRRIMLETTY